MNELQLREIHLPEAGLWWPPAPGWWFALALLLTLILVVPWIVRRFRYRPLGRLCLDELDLIRQQYASGQRKNASVRDVAALLRRTVISYQGRTGYAASTGELWLSQLQSLDTGNSFNPAHLELLGRDRYRRDFDCDIDSLLQACERWMQALPRSVIHVSN